MDQGRGHADLWSGGEPFFERDGQGIDSHYVTGRKRGDKYGSVQGNHRKQGLHQGQFCGSAEWIIPGGGQISTGLLRLRRSTHFSNIYNSLINNVILDQSKSSLIRLVKWGKKSIECEQNLHEKFVGNLLSLTFAARSEKKERVLFKTVWFSRQKIRKFFKIILEKFGRNKKALTFALPNKNGVLVKRQKIFESWETIALIPQVCGVKLKGKSS